jgi:hypothetical protein
MAVGGLELPLVPTGFHSLPMPAKAVESLLEPKAEGCGFRPFAQWFQHLQSGAEAAGLFPLFGLPE